MTSKWWADLYCTAVEQLLFMLCTDVKRISTILFSARLSSMRQSREFRRMHSRQHGPGGDAGRSQTWNTIFSFEKMRIGLAEIITFMTSMVFLKRKVPVDETG
jgi:hypothetical protein